MDGGAVNSKCAQQRVQCLAGGNPVRQGVATPPVANLGHAVATLWVKRRKLGSRVIRHFSTEITVSPVCRHGLLHGRQHVRNRYGEILYSTAVLEVSHATQWHCINWGEPVVSISDEKIS